MTDTQGTTVRPRGATAPPRRIEPICPPWCAGHTGDYQGWETRAGRQLRNHGEHGASVGKVTVSVEIDETEEHQLTEPRVFVWCDDDPAQMTADQASQMASLIDERVAWIRAWRRA